MIKFDILEMNKDGTSINLKVSIIDNSYTNNVYIKSVKIDNQDSFKEGGASTNTIYEKSYSGENKKEIELTIHDYDILGKMKSDLLFIYAETEGNPSPDIPCGMDNNRVCGIIYYSYPIYQNLLNIITGISNSCECLPKSALINAYMNYKAFQFAIITGNTYLALKYYNKFYSKKFIKLTNNCNCYGTSK